MALTREKLLTSARKLYLGSGYDGTSIEKIAEDGGFSRGAFYAHFSSKEAIFLELVRVDAGMLLPGLLDAVNNAASRNDMIDAICAWADKRLLSRDISYLLLEVLQHAGRSNNLTAEQMSPIRENWRQLGEALQKFFPDGELPGQPEEVGAIVMLQIADGPFVEAAGGPSTSRLIRLMLQAFVR
ncbi:MULTISPECIES: TetR/AcrR family transcriptional regulator [Agrobacterium]|uniref:TetR/AcrR family transcriptional regulator n=1 Tax=Agrobacterium tumefaciens TaxID=358 RepID=UPI0013CE5642|nr:TetR/AcrR family transcriptional regulator [Agrobacterium tumefaciens]NSY93312.1 TetR/AcrR family transcriptional regulator [Agrobacterium tumefaciens]